MRGCFTFILGLIIGALGFYFFLNKGYGNLKRDVKIAIKKWKGEEIYTKPSYTHKTKKRKRSKHKKKEKVRKKFDLKEKITIAWQDSLKNLRKRIKWLTDDKEEKIEWFYKRKEEIKEKLAHKCGIGVDKFDRFIRKNIYKAWQDSVNKLKKAIGEWPTEEQYKWFENRKNVIKAKLSKVIGITQQKFDKLINQNFYKAWVDSLKEIKNKMKWLTEEKEREYKWFKSRKEEIKRKLAKKYGLTLKQLEDLLKR